MNAGRLPQGPTFWGIACPNSFNLVRGVEICPAAYHSESAEIAPLQGTRIDAHQICLVPEQQDDPRKIAC